MGGLALTNASANAGKTGANSSLTRLFKDLRREAVTEQFVRWHGNGSDPNYRGFLIYRAAYDPQGHYLGGIVGLIGDATLEQKFLNEENRGFDLGPSGVIAILNHHSGEVLSHMGPPILRVAADTSQLLSFASDSALQAHRYVSPFDGVRRLGVFLNLNNGRWVLMASLAERDLLNSWFRLVVLGVLAFLVIAMLQWVLLHYVHANFLQRERLAQEARHDPLTNLSNRRHFGELAHGACSLARRYQQPLCVLSLDLDFFKKINDTYGHDFGDAMLKHMAHTLRGSLRESDIAARFGGEEFVVAMPHTTLDVAQEVAERIRAGIATHAVKFKDLAIRLTVSIGAAQITTDELEVSEGIHAALARADQALYQSKHEGRNRVTVAR